MIRSLRNLPKVLRLVLPAAAMIASSALLESCSSGSSVNPPEPASDGVYLSMTLSLPKQQSVSRADGATSWDEAYDATDASNAESAINPAKVTVVVRQGDKAVALAAGSGDYDLKGYYLNDQFLILCNLDDYIARGLIDAGLPYDVEVYANTSSSFDSTDPDALTFSRSNINGGNPLPMFGFRRNLPALKLNAVNTVGTIDLLRSVAKIQVRLADEAAERFEFSKAPEIANGLALIPSTGYHAPLRSDWSTVSSTGSLSFEQSFRPAAANAGANGNIVFPSATADGYVIYVPEAVNADGNTRQLGIDVSLRSKDDNGSLSTGRLYFTAYDPDTHLPVAGADRTQFTLARNHNYLFTILDAAKDLELHYAVIDLTEIEIDVPEFE